MVDSAPILGTMAVRWEYQSTAEHHAAAGMLQVILQRIIINDYLRKIGWERGYITLFFLCILIVFKSHIENRF